MVFETQKARQLGYEGSFNSFETSERLRTQEKKTVRAIDNKPNTPDGNVRVGYRRNRLHFYRL